MPVGYPSNPNAIISIDALLRQPTLISRDLVTLVSKRLVADRIFAHGTPDQVAGGAMQFERSESIFLDKAVEEIAARADWPRAGAEEQIFTALVKQFGLEVPLSNLAIRRSRRDQYARQMLRLGNQIVKFVDTQAMTILTDTVSTPTIQTMAASALWTNTGTKIIADVAAAQELIDVLDEGLLADTLVLNVARRPDILNNVNLSALLPREARDGMVQTGTVAPFLGLSQILFTNQLAVTKALVLQSKMVGTIVDELPDPTEGFVAHDVPNPETPPIWVKVYDENRPKDKIIAGGRWPAMALIEPRAVVVITGVA